MLRIFRAAGVCVAATASVTACEHVVDGGPDSIDMAKSLGDAQTAQAGTPVAVRPAVSFVDQHGRRVPGVVVTFTVTSGNGRVTEGTVMSGSDGVAAVGSWILGPVPAVNSLIASAAGASDSPQTFYATGSAASPVAHLGNNLTR